MRTRPASRADDAAGDGQADALRERAVGEPVYAQPAGALTTTLRPQQSRNVIWRWQLRRRQRAR